MNMKSFYLVALAAVALPATAQEVVDVDSVAVADCEIEMLDLVFKAHFLDFFLGERQLHNLLDAVCADHARNAGEEP